MRNLYAKQMVSWSFLISRFLFLFPGPSSPFQPGLEEPSRKIQATTLNPAIQRFGDIHEQPAKKEQRQDRKAHNDRKGVPIISWRVVIEFLYLDREVSRHEADWEEQNAKFRQQGGGTCEARCWFGIFLGVDIEVLSTL